MSSSFRYALVGTALVGLVVLLAWPFLDPVGRRGVAVAAAVALPVQIGSFAALVHLRTRQQPFLIAWVGGTLLRMAAIGVVAVVVVRSGEGVVPTLMALASFFFGLLLLEPMYFRAGQGEAG
jgi:peptidoglycan/LPS O-acetylase OafA/YrhL